MKSVDKLTSVLDGIAEAMVSSEHPKSVMFTSNGGRVAVEIDVNNGSLTLDIDIEYDVPFNQVTIDPGVYHELNIQEYITSKGFDTEIREIVDDIDKRLKGVQDKLKRTLGYYLSQKKV